MLLLLLLLLLWPFQGLHLGNRVSVLTLQPKRLRTALLRIHKQLVEDLCITAPQYQTMPTSQTISQSITRSMSIPCMEWWWKVSAKWFVIIMWRPTHASLVALSPRRRCLRVDLSHNTQPPIPSSRSNSTRSSHWIVPSSNNQVVKQSKSLSQFSNPSSISWIWETTSTWLQIRKDSIEAESTMTNYRDRKA